MKRKNSHNFLKPFLFIFRKPLPPFKGHLTSQTSRSVFQVSELIATAWSSSPSQLQPSRIVITLIVHIHPRTSTPRSDSFSMAVISDTAQNCFTSKILISTPNFLLSITHKCHAHFIFNLYHFLFTQFISVLLIRLLLQPSPSPTANLQQSLTALPFRHS